ncbi:hypothetical protein D9M71_390260 [compost metagenome]
MLDIAFGSVDHEHALTGGGVLLVQYQDAGRDAGTVEEVGRQADDALEDAGSHQLLPDDRLGVAPEEHTVGQDAGGFASSLHAADDVQQIGVVALLGGRNAPAKALIEVILRGEAGTPGLVGKGWICDHVVVGCQQSIVLLVFEFGRGQGVAGEDVGRGEVVQDHVHPRQAGGGDVLLLPFQGDFIDCFSGNFQQQRAGAAGRVVGGGSSLGVVGRDADDLGDDSADFRRRVELALTLARILGEMAHQVFVGVAKDVIVLGAVLREI